MPHHASDEPELMHDAAGEEIVSIRSRGKGRVMLTVQTPGHAPYEADAEAWVGEDPARAAIVERFLSAARAPCTGTEAPLTSP